MAKFVDENGNTISSDRLMREKRMQEAGLPIPPYNPALEIEVRLLGAIKDISKNLTNPTLDNTCIIQLIKGESCECKMERNCNKCICHWYMSKE